MKQLKKRRITILLSIVLVFALACATRLISRISFAAYTLPDPAVIGTATLEDEGDTVFVRMANFNLGTEEYPYYSVGVGFTVGNFGTAEDPTQNVDMNVLTPLYSETALRGVLDKNIYICGGSSYLVDLYVDGLTLTEGHTLTAAGDFDMKMGDLTVSGLIAPNATIHIGDKAALTVNGDAVVRDLWFYAPNNRFGGNFYNPGCQGGALRVKGSLTSRNGWLDMAGASSLTVDGDLSGFTANRFEGNGAVIANGSRVNVGGDVSGVSGFAISNGCRLNVVGSVSAGKLVAWKDNLIHVGGDLDSSDGDAIVVQSAISVGGSVQGRTINLLGLTAPATMGSVNASSLYVSGERSDGTILTVAGPIRLTTYLDIYKGATVTGGDVDVYHLFMEMPGSVPNVLNADSLLMTGQACLNGRGTLNVAGDCRIVGSLFNVRDSSRMNVGGDVYLNSSIDVLDDSTLSVAGDITATADNGLPLQAFSGSSITCDGNVSVRGAVTAQNNSHITVAGVLKATSDLGVLSFGEGSTVEADAMIATNFTSFGSSSIIVHRDAKLDNMAYVRNSSTIRVGGNLDCKQYSIGQKSDDRPGEPGGSIYVDGDLTVNMENGNIDTGVLSIGGDFVNTSDKSGMNGSGIAVYGGKLAVGGNVEFGRLLLNTAGHPELLEVAGQINAMRITDIKCPVDENDETETIRLFTVAPFEAATSGSGSKVYYVQPYRQKYVLLEDSQHALYYADVSDLSKVAFDAVPLTGLLVGTASGSKVSYTVVGVPEGSLLIAARYNGGKLTCVRTLETGGNKSGTLDMDDGSGTEYKLMLVDSSYAPLCKAVTTTATTTAITFATTTASMHAIDYELGEGVAWAPSATIARMTIDGVEIALPIADDVVNPGKRLTGWNTSADGKGASYAAGEVLNCDRDLTLYPQWENAPLKGRLTISGSAVYHETLTAALTSDNNTGALSYQWYRGDTPIEGAAAAAYTLAAADVGETISCVVTSDAQTGSVSSRTALAVAPIPVTITGLTAADKTYDGTTDVEITGEATLEGVLEGDKDAVSLVPGTAAFGDADAGKAKPVTFSGWSITGAAAGGYVLSAQPALTRANITPKSITPSAALGFTQTVYNREEQRPAVTVTAGEAIVPEDAYTVRYSGNVNAGTALVLVESEPGGNYAFTAISKSFTIARRSITPTLALAYETVEYDGYDMQPQVTVMDGDAEVRSREYIVEYSDNTDVGTATVTVKAASGRNYDFADATATFTITPKSITPVVELEYDSVAYDGTAKKPTVTVWFGDEETLLTEGTDFTIEYSDNTDVGTATVTVRAKEGSNYTFADIELTFTIN